MRWQNNFLSNRPPTGEQPLPRAWRRLKNLFSKAAFPTETLADPVFFFVFKTEELSNLLTGRKANMRNSVIVKPAYSSGAKAN
jgi:hypothetical protein